MQKQKAIAILMNDGWDLIGAREIVSTLIDDDMLDDMTSESLLTLSEDYKDR